MTVTVYSGFVTAPGIVVYLKAPDGTLDTETTNTSGQASFARSGTGIYKVGLTGQSAQTPVEYTIDLRSGQTLYGISLQLFGAAFAVTAPTGQGNGYGWQSASKNWTIQYLNNSDLAADLDVMLSSSYPVPTSWTASLSPPFLRKGESATLNVVVPQGSQVGTPTLRILGKKSDGTILLFADIVMPQEWSFKIRRTYTLDFGGTYQCGSNQTRLVSIVATAETIGVPAGALVMYNPVAIAPEGCSTCGPQIQTFTGFWGTGTVPFYPGIINAFSVGSTSATLASAYRSNNAGACTGNLQSWLITTSWAIGSTVKTVADTMYYQLAYPTQTFSFFN